MKPVSLPEKVALLQDQMLKNAPGQEALMSRS